MIAACAALNVLLAIATLVLAAFDTEDESRPVTRIANSPAAYGTVNLRFDTVNIDSRQWSGAIELLGLGSRGSTRIIDVHGRAVDLKGKSGEMRVRVGFSEQKVLQPLEPLNRVGPISIMPVSGRLSGATAEFPHETLTTDLVDVELRLPPGLSFEVLGLAATGLNTFDRLVDDEVPLHIVAITNGSSHLSVGQSLAPPQSQSATDAELSPDIAAKLAQLGPGGLCGDLCSEGSARIDMSRDFVAILFVYSLLLAPLVLLLIAWHRSFTSPDGVSIEVALAIIAFLSVRAFIVPAGVPIPSYVDTVIGLTIVLFISSCAITYCKSVTNR